MSPKKPRPHEGERIRPHASTGAAKTAHLQVRCDRALKGILERAASLRGLSVSDYVRSRVVPLAKQDIAEAETGVLRLPRDAQIAFWLALQQGRKPTPAQRRLGKQVRELLQE